MYNFEHKYCKYTVTKYFKHIVLKLNCFDWTDDDQWTSRMTGQAEPDDDDDDIQTTR